jgi:aminoglycoside phosphotransferase (APT) family kinase protein
MTRDSHAVLVEACHLVGLAVTGAELISASENDIYRLRAGIVARISRSGQVDAARKEVLVSRWLIAMGVPAVEALTGVDQPVDVDGRAVTFWRELPPHRSGTTPELASLLQRLHSLPAPDFELPPLAPFVRLEKRISEAAELPFDEQQWLLQRLSDLRGQYAELPVGQSWCAVHGDAWGGNVAVTEDGPVMLDLERFAYGPPEWDLTSVAFDFVTTGFLAQTEWADFCAHYGYDVTTWAGFEVLRDIRELRKVTFAWQLAGERLDIAEQARYRLACIRGEHGPRPWSWTGVP